jgi:hypothetical protein
MGGVKLSDVIEVLHKDEEMKKLAQEAGIMPGGGTKVTTETPDSEMVGESVEDEKAKIQTKLMELAGTETEAVSSSKVEESLNVANKAPAGEKIKPVEEATADAAGMPKASPASEVTEVVASALGKMKPEVRKEACKGIIKKMAEAKMLTLDELEKVEPGTEKTGGMSGEDWETAGRLMARGYVDEMNKMAEEAAQKEEGGEESLSEEDITAIEELIK